MFDFLKKLFYNPGVITDTENSNEPKKDIQNKSLVDRLGVLLVHPYLERIFFSSVNKLYVMSTYATDFNDFLNNLTTPSVHRTLSAVNVHAYFNKSNVDLSYQLERISHYIASNKINTLVEHDLNEICDTFEYFLFLEETSRGE